MFEQIIKFITGKPSQPTQIQARPRPQQGPISTQRPSMFNLPPDWTPIDSVIDTTRIPDTNLEIGTSARVVETNLQERIEFNQRRGVRVGCNHLIFSANKLGGICPFCMLESAELLSQGLISQLQAEEKSLFCVDCSSYCMVCFKRICSTHTRLFQCPDMRIIPLCPACYEQLSHKNIIWRIISVLIGLLLVWRIISFLIGL